MLPLFTGTGLSYFDQLKIIDHLLENLCRHHITHYPVVAEYCSSRHILRDIAKIIKIGCF